MRHAKIIFVILLSCTYKLYSQTILKGTVIDTLENRKLSNAVISLVNSKDSLLLYFTRTDKNGEFNIPPIAKEKLKQLFILVTYPGYADYYISGKTDSVELIMRKVRMSSTVHLLEEVVVRQGVRAIRVNNDTIEFKADSFRVEKNANIEDLLKKFPGFQIDANGKIIANGQRVEQILVDGEEYFGGDPTLVSRNLRADLIDKVQLFDKRTDQAAFTGIDDGKRVRTVNLKVKEDKNNTFFGKLGIAGGDQGYYNGELMANRFNKKQKWAIFGMGSNTNKQSLAIQDENRYGDSENGIGYRNSDLLDSWSGNYEGIGDPTVLMSGAHYNDRWGVNNQLINGNFRFVDFGVKGQTTNTRNLFSPGFELITNQTLTYKNHLKRNGGNLVYDLPIDSSSSLKLNLEGTMASKSTNSVYELSNIRPDGSVLSKSTRSTLYDGNTQFAIGSLFYRKRFKKKGRTISFSISSSYSNNDSHGFLKSLNYYGTTTGFYSDTVDQYKTNLNKYVNLNSKLTYTEPLSTKSAFTINGSATSSQSISDRVSYNSGLDGKYIYYDSAFSNRYEFNILTYRPGLFYTYRNPSARFSVTMGSDFGFSLFRQSEIAKNNAIERKYINLFPQLSIGYKKLVVSYSGSTNQPTMSQIQPLRNNEDPLNILLGNSELQPSFNHNFQATYVDARSVKRQNFWIQLSYNFLHSGVSTSDQFDNTGKRVFKYVNVDGMYNISNYVQFDFFEKRSKINFAFSGTLNQYANVNYINSQKVTNISTSYILGTSISKSVDRKFDFLVRYSGAFWVRTINGISNSKIDYWVHNIRPSIDLYLPQKMQLHFDAQLYLLQRATGFGNNDNLYLVNMFLSKKYFKSEVLSLKLSIADIFNSNKGISRVVNSTYASQTVSNTIMRYLLIGITYDFVKNPTRK